MWGFERHSLRRLLVVSVVRNHVEVIVVSSAGETVELDELGSLVGSVKDNLA